jgi:hypothetical protein
MTLSFDKKVFNAVWPLDLHEPKLGSLLMFRKAVENFLDYEDYEACDLAFVGDQTLISNSLNWVDQVFSGVPRVRLSRSAIVPNEAWPLHEAINWYSTWYGIESQVELGRGSHVMNWHGNVKARRAVTCHLKICPSSAKPEIEHADCIAWHRFFDSRPHTNFILLGDDAYPSSMVALANVTLARDDGLSLADQLALITTSSGFVGSASGFSAAAVLSRIPYAIFKHPDHHPEEYVAPRFRGPFQNILRATDRLENIQQWTNTWMK